MRLFFQILFFFLTCFTSSASFATPKVFISNYTVSFPKTENVKQASEVKISLENFARSSIEEQQAQTSTFHQNTFLLSSYLKEENSCALVFQTAANSKSVVEGIQTGIDIISLVIPGAQTCTALKMLNYLDKASSIASLSGSYLQDDYPDLANVLNITSSILAITDLSANGVDILLKANTNPSAAIDIISESEDVLDATAHIEHVEVLLDRITAPSPDPQVLAVLNSSNPKTKDFFLDILEAEKHSAKGADRMDIVNKIDEAIEVVQGVGSALVQSLSPALKNIHNKLVAGGVQIFEQGNVIKYVTENGNEFAKIENGVFSVSFNKPNIPNPSTYLDASYITNHINKFQQEGAGFIVVKSWTEGGNPIYTTLPSRKFVGLRSEMDAVIAKYKSQGNDWTILRDELNLGSNTNLANEEIYYIKINGNDSRFSFDLPNGNEGGAIVGEWVPGGYTKNGTAEAALVGAENIVHNKNINQLLNNFPGMWEKIK